MEVRSERNMKMTGRISLETSREFIVSSLAANGSEKSLLMFTYCCLHSALNSLPSLAFFFFFPGRWWVKRPFELSICIFSSLSHNFHNSDVLFYQRLSLRCSLKSCSTICRGKRPFDGVQQFITVP